MSEQSKHIVVVGAGIVGASIAWHLARAGARVTVLAGGRPGGVATPSSFAWINASAGNPEPYFRLRMRAIEAWRHLAKEVPGLPVAFPGGLRWDMAQDEMEAFVREHAEWGYGIRLVDRAAIAHLEPALSNPPETAVHVADEGVVEPAESARLLLANAERDGVTVLPRAKALGLETVGERVTGVRIDDETISADDVVIAAGAATPELLAGVDVDLALDTPPGLLVRSRPHEKLLNGLVMAQEAHMRQTFDGRVVAGADFGGGDPGIDAGSAAQGVFANVKALLRGGETLELERHTIGWRPMPADRFPVIGRPPRREGLYVAVMHSGVTLAPAVGLFAAEELLDGVRDPLLAPYGPERLAQEASPSNFR